MAAPPQKSLHLPQRLGSFLRLQYSRLVERLKAGRSNKRSWQRQSDPVQQWRAEFDSEIRQLLDEHDPAEVAEMLAQHPTERLHQLLAITQDSTLSAQIRIELDRRQRGDRP